MGGSNINKAVFLDRDGVINKNVFYADSNEWESPRNISDFYLLDNVIDSLSLLQNHNFLLFIVTNQPSYAKGKTSLEELKEILEYTKSLLSNNNINIIEMYCSFKHKDSIYKDFLTPCNYRKPEIQSLIDSKKKYNVNLKDSWFIGDRDTDIECGKNGGTRTIKINQMGEKNNSQADYNVKDLKEASQIILSYKS